jgi:hypothetical protein
MSAISPARAGHSANNQPASKTINHKDQNQSYFRKAPFPAGAISGCDTVSGTVTYRKQSLLLHVLIVAFVVKKSFLDIHRVLAKFIALFSF